MTAPTRLLPHKVERENRTDGTILLRSGHDLPPVAKNIGFWLLKWADERPDAVLLAERDGPDWRTVTYAEALAETRRIAAGLLNMGLGPDRPVAILSGNSLAHGLLALAAQYAGIPYVPLAEQYALIPAAHPRLIHALNLIDPAAVFAEDGAQYAPALELAAMAGRDIICARNAPSGAVLLDELVGEKAVADAAHAETGPDSVAKYLLTSGSTSEPKAVVTTHRMLTTNQAMINAGLPFLGDHPPILVDWLPWNHTFGGSHNFNIVLSNGGSLYIDDGKPLPALFPRTLENLGLVSGTISFNVPVGFAQLVDALRGDPDLARVYFAKLDMIFYAGASLPQETWTALEDLARAHGRNIPLITSSWGLTETAPAVLLQHQPAKGAGIVGVPLPGAEVKLVPDEDGRMDVRVRGDSVFEAYLNQPDKTADAFDDEGFFVTGDAMRFVDEADMSKGLRFDGRLSEDFKLTTGTWVRAANLRLELLPILAPLAQDLVLIGEGRGEVGVLIVPNMAALEAAGFDVADSGGAFVSERLQAEISMRLSSFGKTAGSAARIKRALVLSQPPSMGDGEVTAKGNLNFAKIVSRRSDLVARVYNDTDPAVILVR